MIIKTARSQYFEIKYATATLLNQQHPTGNIFIIQTPLITSHAFFITKPLIRFITSKSYDQQSRDHTVYAGVFR